MFAASASGEFFPMQIICAGKTDRCMPKFNFPDGFHVTYTEIHWSNTEKSLEFFHKVIFLQIDRIKEEGNIPSEQVSLIIMDNFRGQDNDEIIQLLNENKCEFVIVPNNTKVSATRYFGGQICSLQTNTTRGVQKW